MFALIKKYLFIHMLRSNHTYIIIQFKSQIPSLIRLLFLKVRLIRNLSFGLYINFKTYDNLKVGSHSKSKVFKNILRIILISI